MAKSAELQTIMDETVDDPAGYDKQKLRSACYDLWTKKWEQLPTCRMTKDKNILSQAR